MALRPAIVIPATGALLWATASAAWPQAESANLERSTLVGVFTEAQARRGEDTYRKHCSNCHTPSTVSGTPFRKAWAGQTVYAYFELIRSTMPQDRPGRLGRSQYAEIVAYLLRLSGMPPGDRPLPTADEALQQIRIDTTGAEGPADGRPEGRQDGSGGRGNESMRGTEGGR